MSFSNELTIDGLRHAGTNEDLLRALEALDARIDSILRSGGTTQDVRETQQWFDSLLPLSEQVTDPSRTEAGIREPAG